MQSPSSKGKIVDIRNENKTVNAKEGEKEVDVMSNPDMSGTRQTIDKNCVHSSPLIKETEISTLVSKTTDGLRNDSSKKIHVSTALPETKNLRAKITLT